MKKCKECDSLFNNHKYPNQAYCSRKCARSSKRKISQYTCSGCGKLFTRQGSHVYIYCSVECKSKYTIFRQPKNKTTFTCKQCGKKFKRFVFQSSKHTFEYCGRKCSGLSRVRTDAICKFCGCPFHPLKKQSYCSRECFALSTRGRKTGRNNPGWKNGITYKHWGSNWRAQRILARLRDNHTCQVCGVSAKEVHHIIPRRFFLGHMNDANVLSNLITLCPRHHVLVEHSKIQCPAPKS